MNRVVAWSRRLSVVALCAAFVAAFVLPCVCMAGEPAGRGHCGGSEGSVVTAYASCCCGSAIPGASETMTRFIPTPTAAPTAIVGVLPVSYTIARNLPAARAAWSSHGRPAPPVLRI